MIIGVLLLVSACGGEGDPTSASSTGPAPTPASAPPSEPAPTSEPDPEPGPESDPPVTTRTYDPEDPAVADAVFLTAVDEVLAGTGYAGLADEQPGELLVTADAICARLDEGAAPDELVVVFLDALAAASQVTSSADDGVLAGALLGAGVEVFCPEYADRVTSEGQP
jgi:pyruvate/2-oxoglutarate dehydrogenase complex dihydrolipoamide acyltransferase (E2) component